MTPENIAKSVNESKEIRDMQDDLRDIKTIFASVRAGYGYNRSKAEEIIRKNNSSDPIVMARNSNPTTTIPLFRASDQTILDNLAFLFSYLIVKLTAKLGQEVEKENNHTDA